MPKLHLEIHMQVEVSKQFLEQFKLEELGRSYNFFTGNKFGGTEEHHGNDVLAGEIARKCFRNNSVRVYHALATERFEAAPSI